MEGPLCYWGSDWWKGTGDSWSLAPGGCSMRTPVLTPRRPPAVSGRLEGSSCAGGTRRFMPALRRCHGSNAHRRCAAYLAEKLAPSVDAMGARPIAGAPPILLKNSSQDRKSTRLNSSHLYISYAVFCLKKKNREGKYERAHVSASTSACV